jgi:plasmid maintenance system killer protein
MRLAFLAAAASLDDLRSRAGMNLHALQRERQGQHAIRINDQYRIFSPASMAMQTKWKSPIIISLRK